MRPAEGARAWESCPTGARRRYRRALQGCCRCWRLWLDGGVATGFKMKQQQPTRPTLSARDGPTSRYLSPHKQQQQRRRQLHIIATRGRVRPTLPPSANNTLHPPLPWPEPARSAPSNRNRTVPPSPLPDSDELARRAPTTRTPSRSGNAAGVASSSLRLFLFLRRRARNPRKRALALLRTSRVALVLVVGARISHLEVVANSVR